MNFSCFNILILLLGLALNGFSSPDCRAFYSQSEAYRQIRTRVENSYRNIVFQSSYEQNHAYVIADFILQTTDAVIKNASHFNESQNQNELGKMPVNIEQLSKNTSDYQLKLTEIDNTARKKGIFQSKRKQIAKMNRLLNDLTSLNNTAEDLRVNIVRDVKNLKKISDSIHEHISLITNEISFINGLLEKFLVSKDYGLAPFLLLKFTSLKSILTILESKASLIEGKISTIANIKNQSETLTGLGLSMIQDTNPKLGPIMQEINEQKLKDIEEKKLTEEHEERQRKKRIEDEHRRQMEHDRYLADLPERQNRLSEDISNFISLLSNTSSLSSKIILVNDFVKKNLDIMTISETVRLSNYVFKFSFDSVKMIVLNVFLTHFKDYNIDQAKYMINFAYDYSYDLGERLAKQYADSFYSSWTYDNLENFLSCVRGHSTKTYITTLGRH